MNKITRKKFFRISVLIISLIATIILILLLVVVIHNKKLEKYVSTKDDLRIDMEIKKADERMPLEQKLFIDSIRNNNNHFVKDEGFVSRETLYRKDKNGKMSPSKITQKELTKDGKNYKITTTTFDKDGKKSENIEYKPAQQRKNTNYE